MLKHKGTVTVETPRLILRRFTAGDAEAMFRNWTNDADVTKYLTWPPHGTPDVTEAVVASWVNSYEKDSYYHWAITLKENGSEPIGSLLAECDDRIERAHIGYCIGKKWWHRGIMTEALQAVMDFLFDQVGCNRIESRHDANNPNSGKVMAKCGMKLEAVTRQSDWNNQGICDTCHYALLAEDRK